MNGDRFVTERVETPSLGYLSLPKLGASARRSGRRPFFILGFAIGLLLGLIFG